jgi:hypothetical protein
MDIIQRLTLCVAKQPRSDAAPFLLEAINHIESLRQEIRVQRAEIGQLRHERNLLLEWDKPPMQQYDKENTANNEVDN